MVGGKGYVANTLKIRVSSCCHPHSDIGVYRHVLALFVFFFHCAKQRERFPFHLLHKSLVVIVFVFSNKMHEHFVIASEK